MSGIMTRYVPWLAELQPRAFREIDPELAVEKGIKNGDWVDVTTRARRDRSARARQRAACARCAWATGKRVHQIGIPYNYGDMVALCARRFGRRPHPARAWIPTFRFTKRKR